MLNLPDTKAVQFGQNLSSLTYKSRLFIFGFNQDSTELVEELLANFAFTR